MTLNKLAIWNVLNIWKNQGRELTFQKPRHCVIRKSRFKFDLFCWGRRNFFMEISKPEVKFTEFLKWSKRQIESFCHSCTNCILTTSMYYSIMRTTHLLTVSRRNPYVRRVCPTPLPPRCRPPPSLQRQTPLPPTQPPPSKGIPSKGRSTLPPKADHIFLWTKNTCENITFLQLRFRVVNI